MLTFEKYARASENAINERETDELMSLLTEDFRWVSFTQKAGGVDSVFKTGQWRCLSKRDKWRFWFRPEKRLAEQNDDLQLVEHKGRATLDTCTAATSRHSILPASLFAAALCRAAGTDLWSVHDSASAVPHVLDVLAIFFVHPRRFSEHIATLHDTTTIVRV